MRWWLGAAGPSRLREHQAQLRRACMSGGLCVILPLLQYPALAGTYELVDGQGISVCEAYRQNLEPRHDDTPMACERRYDPAVLGFSAPTWQELGIREHLGLYREAWAYLQRHNTAPMGGRLSDKDIEAESQNLTAAGVRLFKAQLELTGDGRHFNVLAVREPGCGPHQSPQQATTRLFVLNSAGTHVAKHVPEGWAGLYNDTIELYQNTPYLESYSPDDDWGTLLIGSGVLRISRFKHSGFGLESVCAIKWTPSAKTEE